jgi:membrane fusion protein, heavy metal efflux system
MRNVTVALVFGGLLSILGCGRDRESRSADSADTTMAGMPGMEGMAGMAGMSASASATPDTNVVTLTAAQIATVRVAWATLLTTTVTGEVEVPGQLVANEDRTARIAAPAQARVLGVHVSPGDRVTPGARLVTLQSQEGSAAYADVSKAQAEVASRRAGATYAKAARDRAERLLGLKAIPRQDYERAIADDEFARALLSQAEAELRRARSAAEQLGVDVQTGAMVLRSPIGGVVTTREVAPGAVVNAGTPLLAVTDPATLWLAVALPESFASGVGRGSTLRFTVAPYPADTFSARVQSVSAAFDAATRTLPVRGIVVNVRGRLRPEMYARVWVRGSSGTRVLTVPDSAVQRLGDKSVVFVAHPDGKGGARFERRDVELGRGSQGMIPVLRGLSGNELVVVAGAYAIKAQFAKGKMPAMVM